MSHSWNQQFIATAFSFCVIAAITTFVFAADLNDSSVAIFAFN
jgi:hypothetical protein